MRDDKKIFMLGERRYVSLDIWLESGMSFTPGNPKWTLRAPDGTEGDPAAAGAVQTAQGWTLSALVEPTSRGDWLLTFAFDLGDEHVKRPVRIKVV